MFYYDTNYVDSLKLRLQKIDSVKNVVEKKGIDFFVTCDEGLDIAL